MIAGIAGLKGRLSGRLPDNNLLFSKGGRVYHFFQEADFLAIKSRFSSNRHDSRPLRAAIML